MSAGRFLAIGGWMSSFCLAATAFGAGAEGNDFNVLLLIADDLTATALSCYGNQVCQTPNIDRLANQGIRFRGAYCQATYCGPSRASFLTSYYPHATGVLGYVSPREAIGDRETWPEYFRNAGYHTARVSKVFHMGVPGEIESGVDGADDPRSWVERFNSQGPEWRAPGSGETLEGNPDRTRPVVGGNTFVVVKAEGDDLVHSDGKTAAKACELIHQYRERQFFLAVGFVRPHVPFVAPAPYFEAFEHSKISLPTKFEGDWEDIPPAGINYKTSKNMKMDLVQQRKSVAGYYASVAYLDRQIGKVMAALEQEKLRDRTIVIFTSDHGYHLGEHDFWAKVSLLEESVRVPLVVCVPGKEPAVCDSFVELIDLFPTVAKLCGLPIPKRLQGQDFGMLLEDPNSAFRQQIFSVNGKGFLIRDQRWAFLQYAEDSSGGMELYDMQSDPHQFTNLAQRPEYQQTVADYQRQVAAKLAEIRASDLRKPEDSSR